MRGKRHTNTDRAVAGEIEARSVSLAHELSVPNGALRRTLALQAGRLRKLADAMEEEGACLKILGTTDKRLPQAFGRGAELCGAADSVREWVARIDELFPSGQATG